MALRTAAAVKRLVPGPVKRLLREPYAKLLSRPDEHQPQGAEPALPVPPRRPIPPAPDLIIIPPPAEDQVVSAWPSAPPPGYLGQLEPASQQALAEQRRGLTLSDCLFYHRAVLPDGRVVEGSWNLVGGEQEYLGGIDLGGCRVLELGPASGWLTIWMEGRGAEVVGFDIGWDVTQDLMPLPGMDLETARVRYLEGAFRIQNAWWFLQQQYGHSAKIAYGSIYDLPGDLGRFDVSVFGSILLHLRDPFLALHQAADRTDRAIVVVEPLRHGPREVDRPLMEWNPTRGVNPSGWWSISPGAMGDMLRVLGFSEQSLTYHQHPCHPEALNAAPGEAVDVVNYTVVARRPG